MTEDLTRAPILLNKHHGCPGSSKSSVEERWSSPGIKMQLLPLSSDVACDQALRRFSIGNRSNSPCEGLAHLSHSSFVSSCRRQPPGWWSSMDDYLLTALELMTPQHGSTANDWVFSCTATLALLWCGLVEAPRLREAWWFDSDVEE